MTERSDKSGKTGMKDIIGKRFGKLVVLEYVGSGKYKCKCDCGNEKIILRSNLTTKNTRSATRSCGCGQARKPQDLTGKTFGTMTVVKQVKGNHGNYTSFGENETLWECVCEYGNTHYMPTANLLRKEKYDMKCDCLRKDIGTSLLLQKKKRNHKSSGFVGVCLHKSSGLWRAYITYQGVMYSLKYYHNLNDAVQARRAAEKELLDPLWEKIKKGEKSKELEDRLKQIVKENSNENNKTIC